MVPRVAGVLHGHAGRPQHRGIRPSLIDERVVAGGEDERRREAAVVRSVDRRGPRVEELIAAVRRVETR